MSDELNSQLSAFVDDELTPEESELFVRRLCRDENLRRTAASYGIIGDAIRGETAVTAPGNFVAGVMMAVEGQSIPAVKSQPVQQGHSMRNWGFALAASAVLAAIALVTLPVDGPEQAETLVAENTVTLEGSDPTMGAPEIIGIDPADGEVQVVAGIDGTNVPIVMPISAERRAQLNNLLLQHLNSSTSATRQPGLVSFRNVGFVTQTEAER